MSRRKGFTLIEVLLVVVLLAVVLLATATAFSATLFAVKDARMLQIAKHVAQLKMEEVLGNPMPQIGTSQQAVDGFPGFRVTTTVAYPDDWRLGGLPVVVSVSYRFLQGEREFRLSSIYYSPIYNDGGS